jgi:short-subunit dehydrogenase
LTDQNRASTDVAYLASELHINAISVTVCAELLASALEAQGRGTLGVIGSVAGDRGRAYNYAYGASKAMVAAFVAGLQQRLASTKVKVCLIKPGPTATPMTANHRGRMADPALVAKQIVVGLSRGKRIIYTPKVWVIIMLIVRLIPFGIFKRLNF